jgi:CheY-like chemotaxis protein
MSSLPASRLLLADDDKDDRDLFSEALASLDPAIRYEGAEDGQQVLQLLSDNHTDLPAIIFLDINMPVMNGWEVLRKVKSDSRYLHIPVIVYSTASGENVKRVAAELGAVCFVTKPDSFRLVKSMLEVVIAHVKSSRVTEKMCVEIHRVLKAAEI